MFIIFGYRTGRSVDMLGPYKVARGTVLISPVLADPRLHFTLDVGHRFAEGFAEGIEDAVIALSGFPRRALPWKQFRSLGCASLMLCDVAAGGLDGLIDSAQNLAPWDYLGGYLACVEAGAVVREANGDELVTDDPTVRRQVMAASTPALLDALMPSTTARA